MADTHQVLQRKPTRRVTSIDVAREAGVSQATVSVVLSGATSPIRVSSATRSKVVAAAERLGYVPNYSAQSLRLRRTRAITFINPAPENPYFAEVVAGAQAAAEDAGYSISIAAVPTCEAALQMLGHLNAGTSDGVIVGSRDPRVLAELRHAIRRGVAAVALQFAGEDPSVPVVRSDKEGGGYLATRHLIDLGHRRIAHVTDAEPYASHPAERTAGYRRALADADLPLDPAWIVPAENGFAGGDAGLRRLLEQTTPDNRPTAVFMFNDQMAIGALHAAQHLGLSVPDDLAVVGFDGIVLGAYTNPELTTIEQPRPEVGRSAVALILEMLDAPTTLPESQATREVTLPLRLLVRESCGASTRHASGGDLR